jgi:hypothetical protein
MSDQKDQNDQSPKIYQYKKLKDSHPTMKKLQKLEDLAEELGICIYFSSNGTIVNDTDFEHDIYMLDIEDHNTCINTFPCSTEYILRYENPEYIKEQDRIYAERKAQQEEKERLAKIENERILQEAEQKQKAAEEAKERAELLRLKNKYESDKGE